MDPEDKESDQQRSELGISERPSRIFLLLNTSRMTLSEEIVKQHGGSRLFGPVLSVGLRLRQSSHHLH